MTDDDALLRAVLESPADDGLRLILADWYDEHAQPARAEFIRVGCELEPIRDHADGVVGHVRCDTCRKRYGLVQRERELLADHWPRWGTDWFSFLPNAHAGWLGSDNPVVICQEGRVGVRTARGFPEEVILPTALFLAHAGPLAAAAPITAVRLDREPIAMSGDRMFGWINWSVDREFRMPHQIPPELYALLPDPPEDTLIPVPGLYPSPELAHAALSLAAVNLARERAPGFTHEVRCRCNGDGNRHVAGKPEWIFLNETCPDCSGSGVVRKAGLPPLAEPRPAPVVQ